MSARQMRPSRVLGKLRAGAVVSCFKLNLADARAAEIAAIAGFDCLWLDLEHVPNDLAAIENGIWAAKSQNVDVMVRVARGSYSDYVRPLELDAAGLMVPHVMSLADAEAVVRMTRFHPLGRRPVDEAARAHGKFAGTVASAANLDDLITLGYRFLSMGADVVGLSQYCQSIMAEFTKRPAIASTSLYGGKTK